MSYLSELFDITLGDPSDAHAIHLSLADYLPEKSDGFALPPIARIEEASPSQHGVSDRGFRLLARRLTFQVTLRAQTPQEFYERRAGLLAVLRPSIHANPARLSITLPDGTTWYLGVFCSSLTFSAPAGLLQTALFTLNAPNPVFTQYTPAVATTFYAADVNTTKIVAYPGTWLAVPFPFSMRGPIIHPVVSNLTGGTKLDLNASVPDNQTVVIDLRPSYKTIRLGGTSLLGSLSSDSDLDAFYLLPAPEAPSGCNVIQVTGSGTGANTCITLAYTPTRLGI